jgi:tRNA modification GTPase
LSDTAGLRETTTDLIEQEGMKRARNVAQQADIVLAVVDMTNPNAGLQALEDTLQQPSAMESHDEEIDDDDDDNNDQVTLLVLNKLDLTQSCTEGNLEAWRSKFSFAETCAISCETNDGVDSFLEALTKLVVRRVSGDGDADPKTPGSTLPREGAMITRARHRQHVVAAAEALHRFSKLSQQGSMAVDLAAEELRLAASELGRITGAVDVEDVLDVLFRDFCIGK